MGTKRRSDAKKGERGQTGGPRVGGHVGVLGMGQARAVHSEAGCALIAPPELLKSMCSKFITIKTYCAFGNQKGGGGRDKNGFPHLATPCNQQHQRPPNSWMASNRTTKPAKTRKKRMTQAMSLHFPGC